MRILTPLLLLVLLCFEADAIHSHSRRRRDASGIDGILDASTDIDTDIDTDVSLTPIQESAEKLIKQKKYAELLKTNIDALKKRQKKWDKKNLYTPDKFGSKERMKYPKDKPISLETDGDTEQQRPLYIEQSSTTHVAAPGDCQHLSVTDGDSTWILTNAPLNALAPNAFAVRGAAPNAAFTVTFQIEHAAFLHTVWTRINGVDTPLVLQNGRVTFQVPAAANGQFSIIYGNAIAPLIPVTTYAIVFTYQELTVGLEIEDIATVLFCWDGGAAAAAPHAFPGLPNVATHCDNLSQDDRVTHTVNNVPGTNWPFLKIELDAINGRVGHTEYITGPLPVGRTGGVPNDLRDEQVALSLLLQTFTTELDAAGGGACAGGGDQGWTLFSTVIAAYNVALGNNLGLFTTPANWILVPPTAGQNVKVDGGAAAHPANVGGNYNWYVQCNYLWDANMGANMQVNFAVPLRSIGARKMAAPTPNLPTHFIDLFPAPNEDGAGHWSRYVTRSQWIAHQLIFAHRASWLAAQLRALNPVPKQTTLIQLKGWMASFLMTVIHKVQVACATNRLPHGAPGLDHGASKNFHFNMFKSCLNDLPRYFPRAIGNLLARWWTGAHLPGANPAAKRAALIAGIRDLFERRASWWVGHLNLQNDGRLETTECQTYQPLDPLTGNPLGAQVLAAAHFTASWGIVMASDQIVSTFTPTLAWQPRYPNEGAPVAVPVNMGDQGINVGVNPANNWECMCGVNHPRTIPPLQNLLYGELGMVVESRETGRTLNQAFMPTADPNNIKDVMAGITIIRNVGTQPGSIAQ